MPAIQRLLGTLGELGSRLGLDNKWMLQAIKAGGTWAKSRLMYALPFKS